MKPSTLLLPLTLLLTPSPTAAGPLAYGVCQAGCAAVVTACYAAAGENEKPFLSSWTKA